MTRFRKIVTHVRPHFDEVVAIWLLYVFGQEKFPGISQAEIEYWGFGKTPDGRSAEEYEREGVLLIGVGGGRFDEHPTATKERTAGECAATLVAKALGVRERPELQQILNEVLSNDLNGGGSLFGVPAIIQIFHHQYQENHEKAMDWAMMAVDAKYCEQREFFHGTKQEFEQKAKVEILGWFYARSCERKPLKLVTIISDNEQIAKYARSEHGCYAAAVIQQRTSGNVMIFANKYYKPDFSLVASALRVRERGLNGQLPAVFDELLDIVLRSEGKVAGAEEWFYHKGMEALLNGSSTAPDVPPTKIKLSEIVAIVKTHAVFA